jgi:hypothetical protein
MKRITVELLKAHGACSEEIEQFQELFPKGAPVSMRSFNKAREAGLDVFWTEILLAGPARAEYERVTGPARAKYQRVTEQAWAEYERLTGPARAKYQRVTEQALVEALKMQEANDDSND